MSRQSLIRRKSLRRNLPLRSNMHLSPRQFRRLRRKLSSKNLSGSLA